MRTETFLLWNQTPIGFRNSIAAVTASSAGEKMVCRVLMVVLLVVVVMVSLMILMLLLQIQLEMYMLPIE